MPEEIKYIPRQNSLSWTAETLTSTIKRLTNIEITRREEKKSNQNPNNSTLPYKTHQKAYESNKMI